MCVWVSKPAYERSTTPKIPSIRKSILSLLLYNILTLVMHDIVFIQLCGELIYKDITMYSWKRFWPGGGERPQSWIVGIHRSTYLFKFRLGIKIRTSWHALQLLWALAVQFLSSTQTFTSKSAQPRSCFLLSKINSNIRVYLLDKQL